MWEIRKYSIDLKGDWDEFIKKSRNSTFLFLRDYMDYHQERFTDCSLMAYRKGRLASVLPANREGSRLFSHQGLTYGGWVFPPDGLDTSELFEMWRSWIDYCARNDIEKIIYKPLPYIYSLRPSQEDLYLLYLSGAKLIQCDISSAIDLTSNPGFNKLQKRHLKKNSSTVIAEVTRDQETSKIEEFHKILSDCLYQRHAAQPVHSEEELQLLISRFPDNIRLWSASEGGSGKMLAGILAFETPVCLHCQYIATTEEGREKDVLPALVNKMIQHYTKSGKRYFDFGISNENCGRMLNAGLNRQKTSFGASGVACQRYEINVISALQSLPTELWPAK